MKKIGIYGGAFDPPHVGHINAAAAARKKLGLDEIILVPTKESLHKTEGCGASAEQRCRMLEIASGRYDYMRVSDAEIRRDGISYTCDTIREIRDDYPRSDIFLLLGTDALAGMQSWKESQYIQKNVQIAALRRGDKKEEMTIKAASDSLSTKVLDIRNSPCSISSTQLKRLLAFGCGKKFLPDGVYQYIQEQNLYNVSADWKTLPMDRLEKVVISLLNPNRVRHVLGCRDTAVELAQKWGANTEDAARAGILHDITKALDGPLQLTLCDAYGKILDEFSQKYPKTLHALTGSLVAERIFGENEHVVSAICSHTTGKADMNILEAIIYVADYMEPNRDFPGVDTLRTLAYSDIFAALHLGLEMTLDHLKNQGSEVSPMTREALAYLDARHV